MNDFYLVRGTEFFNILLYQHAFHEPNNTVGANLIGFDAIKFTKNDLEISVKLVRGWLVNSSILDDA